MSKDDQKIELSQRSTEETGEARRPYSPPAIEEEALIENLAMSCAASKDCAPSST